MNFTRVSYSGLIVDIRAEDLEQGLRLLREMSDEDREKTLRSVKAALDGVLDAVAKKKKLSPQVLRDTANDIGLWFANEIIEGRSEQYKTMVS